MSPGRGDGDLPVVGPAGDPKAEGPEAGGTEDAAGRMDRRQALKVLGILAAAPGLAACGPQGEVDGEGRAAGAEGGGAGGGAPVPSTSARNPLAAGTPADPDLLSPEIPWDPVLTEDEMETLAALCDVILPEDERSPSAAALGAHDFVNEWVSAPYEANERDRVLVRGGLVWIDAESERRFGEGRRFRDLSPEEMRTICDDIHYLPDAAPEFRAAARFFDRVRDLTATAFYTTDEGMADLGYVGNEARADWGPPPPEVLEHLGLA